MSHPQVLKRQSGDTTVEVEAFKLNLFFYASIGSQLTARGQARKRNWWCLWLCKSPVPVKLPTVAMGNTYFAHSERAASLVPAASQEGVVFKNVSDCKLKHWKAGVGVKIKFSAGIDSVSPQGMPQMQELEGVLSHVSVFGLSGDGAFAVAKGPHH